MGFWGSLFGKPVKINDPFFGELLFMEVKADPAKSYFEGWRYFQPTNGKIEVGISGGLEGPAQIQKEFFRQIEDNYVLLIQRIIPLVENAFQEWETDFRITSFEQEFKLVYLFMPDCVEKPIEWEMSFESMPGFVSHNYSYLLTIEMSDYEPQQVSVSQ